MKKFKGLGTLLLITILLLSLSIPVFAGGTSGSITMKNSGGNIKTDSLYSAYKIVGWNMSKVGSDVLYTDMVLTSKYKADIVTSLGAPLVATSSDADVLKAVAALNETDDAKKVAKLAVDLSSVVGVAEYTATAGVFTNLPYGYYLIMETANNASDGTVLSKPILVAVPDKKEGNPAVSVTVKTSTATVEKDIVIGDGANATNVKAAEKKIGDTVNYKLTATIPTYAANATGISYYITDTLSKGLTLTQGSVIVQDFKGVVIPVSGNYTETVTTNIDESTALKIDFIYDKIKDLGPLTITYSATLNQSAKVGSTGNPNSVTLTYSNNPGSGGSSYTTPPKHTIVYTTGIQLTKVDVNAKQTKLSGATFEIYKDHALSICLGTAVTDKDGIAYFPGLDAGTYWIKETIAPAGYDLLKDPIEVKIGVTLPKTVTNGNELAEWNTTTPGFANTGNLGIICGEVINTKGFQLPGTGGMGTTLFTVGGVILLGVAVGLLLIYRRKKKHA
ncbi:MAG: SpaH/EbpB family LPXTG-anchored major pilin [Clostridiales bacterium]